MTSKYRTPPTTLYIRNLSDRARFDDVKRLFEKFGRVVDVTIPLDFYSGRPKGFCFIEFEDARDAEEAQYKMDRQRLFGKEIEVEFARGDRKTPGEMRHRVDERPVGRRGEPDRGDRGDRRDRNGDTRGYRGDRAGGERGGHREERVERRATRSRSRERRPERRRSRSRDIKEVPHSRQKVSRSHSRNQSPNIVITTRNKRSFSNDRDRSRSRHDRSVSRSRESPPRRNGTRSPRIEMSRSQSPV